jgi:hypothetical protein
MILELHHSYNMSVSRNLSEATKRNIAGKQFFKCANHPKSNLNRLTNYDCPLWQKHGDNRGSFDESGFDIDHIVEHSLTNDDSSNNLQALCKMCHSVKTKRFILKSIYTPQYNIQSKNNSKKTLSKNTVSKKSIKNKNQYVGFIYGGSIIKATHIYLFQCNNTDAISHVRKTLVPYFGGNIYGRYVRCKDAKETMNIILEASLEKGYQTDTDCQNILKCNIGDASEFIKNCAGVNMCNVIKLNEAEAKPNYKVENDNDDDDDDNNRDDNVFDDMLSIMTLNKLKQLCMILYISPCGIKSKVIKKIIKTSSIKDIENIINKDRDKKYFICYRPSSSSSNTCCHYHCTNDEEEKILKYGCTINNKLYTIHNKLCTVCNKKCNVICYNNEFYNA